MRFFFPDSQDLVDPSFDFESEKRSVHRLRQRDDVYAHELFTERAYDGLLVSKGVVDGVGQGSAKYTFAQRHRLLRVGAREFFRLESRPDMPVMGDCGAFTYVKDKQPPFTVDEVLEFYSACGFDFGISLDHVILAYQPGWDSGQSSEFSTVPPDIRERQELTLDMAAEFLSKHGAQRLRFQPLGVAQGWSPQSYAASVDALQKIGYDYIAVGGMVPLRTRDILSCLRAIDTVRNPTTRLHMLGITRTENVDAFRRFGVVSFDSTSPLRQAFKDDRDNYYTMDRTYTALRVPQIEGNPSLQKKIRAGIISQDAARKCERTCLQALREFASGTVDVEQVVDALREYELLYDPEHDHSAAYRETLNARPWESCSCDVCLELGYHVILFRGAERNRRRGFHNLWVFYRRLLRELEDAASESRTSGTFTCVRGTIGTLEGEPNGD